MRLIFSIAVGILLILGGCGTAKPNNKPQKRIATKEGKSYSERINDDDKAKTIADNIMKNPGIKKAVVVVSGKNALIGLDVDKGSQNSVTYLKELSMQKVKQTAPGISNIIVTSDEKMYDRISKLNYDLKEGKPLSGIVEEFISLVKTNKKKR